MFLFRVCVHFAMNVLSECLCFGKECIFDMFVFWAGKSAFVVKVHLFRGKCNFVVYVLEKSNYTKAQQ